MDANDRRFSRRRLLSSAIGSAVFAGLGGANAASACAEKSPADLPAPALIAVTLDLEMSMHYPRWEMMEWNYEKGNLTEPVKQYALEACRRVKAKGGVAQCFVVGRVFEQAGVEWLEEIVRDGHAVGNHT